MRKQTNKLTQGFTIIEVLIVLAIAGLILAIVFLAVPALQRNSRNQGIRSDAASILAGVNDFIANNQGQLPTTIACANGTVDITSTVAGTTATQAKVRGGTACSASTTMPTAGTLGTIAIAMNNKCNGNGFATANRSVAAGFRIENTGSTDAPQCIES
jgi:prepilin-type N-terminal cleavage/methylation domain-containing protein